MQIPIPPVKDAPEEEPSSTVEEITAPKTLHEHAGVSEGGPREPEGKIKDRYLSLR